MRADMARDYAMERYAFGRPIGSFQAIKHKLADVYVAIELARSNAYYGAWALASMQPNCRWRRRRRACPRPRHSTLPRKRTSRRMAGLASPGTWTAICSIGVRNSLRWRLVGCRMWKNRLVELIEIRNAAVEGANHGLQRDPEEAAFRAEARAFLAANAERKSPARPVLRLGASSREEVKRCKDGRRKSAMPDLPALRGRSGSAVARRRRSCR